MKRYEVKGVAGRNGDHLAASITRQSNSASLIWAGYGEVQLSQSNPVAVVTSGLRTLYDDVIRQPLPSRIGELASSLIAKESWR